MNVRHPSVEHVLSADLGLPLPNFERGYFGLSNTTSESLAKALAIGCLSRLDPSIRSVNIWDPAVGTGVLSGLLVNSLSATGVNVKYHGQDIDEAAVSVARQRLGDLPSIQLEVADTLAHDASSGFQADLVVVDSPWGANWASSAAHVERRHADGAFRFGLPNRSDSTWLFISLALEKLRPAAEGGGRVAALVAPSALSSKGRDAAVRKRILDDELLESVTRLPESLAPNTALPLYLMTFTNQLKSPEQIPVMVADFQAEFTTTRGHRSLTTSALGELESGLRSRKAGPRNRFVPSRSFVRRDTKLVRLSGDGQRLTWPVTTYRDTAVDAQFVEARYGKASGVSIESPVKETVDFSPSRFFEDEAKQIVKDLDGKGWPVQRLTSLLRAEPTSFGGRIDVASGGLFIPTRRSGFVSTTALGAKTDGRILRVDFDGESVDPEFLAAWLNSETGIASRLRAIAAGSTGARIVALRSARSSLMRWADELIVPVPPIETQRAIVSANDRLASVQSEVATRRSNIWLSPDDAEEIANSIAGVFDVSLTSWLERLPSPIATALWTAETANSLGDKQRAYMHAWEALVAFHATVLLSACRSIPGLGPEVEASIRRTLEANHLGVERISFGTWVLITEKASSEIRKALDSQDMDQVVRVQKAFGGIGRSSIERLTSKEAIRKFNELNTKRNRWYGHSGFTSDRDWQFQIDSLIADLFDLRQIIGDVWTQLVLVRAGQLERLETGYIQTAEVALGTKSPFRKSTYEVGEPMKTGGLYLVRDGAESPLQLIQFVQLRSAPHVAHYTSYFYNRTEGDYVRLVSYQHGSDPDVQVPAKVFLKEFGQLWPQ